MRDPINEELHPYRHDHTHKFNSDLAFMRKRPGELSRDCTGLSAERIEV